MEEALAIKLCCRARTCAKLEAIKNGRSETTKDNNNDDKDITGNVMINERTFMARGRGECEDRET